MNEIQQLVQSVSFEHGWLTGALTLMGALRAFFKLAAPQIRDGLNSALVWTARTKQTADDAFVAAVLGHPLYWFSAWACDYFFSAKLPTLKEFIALHGENKSTT